MLRPRSLALLARALRRSPAGSVASAFSPTPWGPASDQLSRRHSSFVPPRGVGGLYKSKKMPSFAIAAAFEGHEDLEDDAGPDHLYGHEKEPEDAEAERARALKEQFQRGMEKKKLWMQSLAAQKLYAAVVKSVADCYAPLYAAMGLEGKCPLLAVARDEATADHELETQYQPLRFDDMLTKATEQEALALLVKATQPMLALTIVEHRDKLTEELAKRSKAGTGVVLPGTNVMENDNVVTLGSHLRMFYSWAMSAYAMCGPSYHPKLFDIYKRAQDAEIYVSANMNVQYLSALITEMRYDELFGFYESVIRENQPTSVFFYRQMLFAVSVTRKTELLDSILEDMRVKGFKLRAEDYLRAIRTYDNEYFLTETKPKDKRRLGRRNGSDHTAEELGTVFVTPRDTYDMCLKRILEQDDHPETFERLLDAARSVLALFDTMVDIEGLAPRHEHLFPRVITAAVYAQECERVPEILALHAEHADEPLHYAGVRMAVNALLLLEKPTEAWGLIRETNPDLESHRFALVANIFNYLCMKSLGKEIIALMHDVDKLEVQGVFSLSLIKTLVPALCGCKGSVSDDELMKTMAHFDSGFRCRTSEHHFGVFLNECARYGRLAVVKTALKQWLATSGNKRPLKGALAVKLLRAFESESDWAFMAEVFELTDFSHVKSEEDCEVIVSTISRAYNALGQPERIKRAERVAATASKRQKRLSQHKSTKQVRKKGQWRSSRTSGTPSAPSEAKPVMINGIPILSSSS
ncbi:putative mitochondrial protein [Phytophthora cinnamomi]|uniref:putative mitochondrial protein n=1 Tax=Phytophthora cinnamomi TaxID=4785 RepID=UPI00355A6056|nr:putative mitochondrial protein [Phytophthora cinnamomi]